MLTAQRWARYRGVMLSGLQVSPESCSLLSGVQDSLESFSAACRTPRSHAQRCAGFPRVLLSGEDTSESCSAVCRTFPGVRLSGVHCAGHRGVRFRGEQDTEESDYMFENIGENSHTFL